jgi:D-threo-aldose 1-dehydrogenase
LSLVISAWLPEGEPRASSTTVSAKDSALIKVQLSGVPFALSRFIFGTARLFSSGTMKERQALLFAAVDAGFTHFDTAPYYGFGLAERDLAPILKAHPDVTVTTKVGIYSPGGDDQGDAAVFLRKALGRLITPISRPTINFSLACAKKSLEGSLRRLNRERIDIYALHEPELYLLNTEEWLDWLEACVSQGKIRTFGLALAADRLERFLCNDSPLTRYVQVADSLNACEADVLARYGKPIQVTYAYISSAHKEGSNLPVSEILRQALLRNADGAIIASTTKVARLQQYAKIAEEASRAQ